MRTAALTGGRVAVLAGATVLAFFSGGFFDVPRLVAGVVAWLLVAAAALLALPLFPRSTPGRVAVAGLAGRGGAARAGHLPFLLAGRRPGVRRRAGGAGGGGSRLGAAARRGDRGGRRGVRRAGRHPVRRRHRAGGGAGHAGKRGRRAAGDA